MVTQYKCPGCGADMEFNAATGKLTCHSCGKTLTEEEYRQAEVTSGASSPKEEPKESSVTGTFQDGEAVQYQCNNCGAILITGPDTAATTCSFCGAPMILSDRLTGDLAPAKIIPFHISKEHAQDAFSKWCHKGRFTPRGYYSPGRVRELTGIYVPFWLFDMNAHVDLTAEGRRVDSHRSGDYIVTNTSYYDISRAGDLSYKRVPTDASERMEDTMMDQLEPFYYEQLKDFQAPYLAGFLAEKYSFTDRALLGRVQGRLQRYADEYVRSTITGYNSITVRHESIDFQKQEADYTFLPVWMVNYNYKNASHVFAMNGQTGKIVGKPPVSIPKVLTWFAGTSFSLFLLLKVIFFFIGGVWW